MKKKDFVTLLLSLIGFMMFGLGMSMCLLPEWDSFKPGVILGSIGMIELLITWLNHRRMNGKPMFKINLKVVGKLIWGAIGTIVFGYGMCLVLVYKDFVMGIVIGIIGIILLLTQIPLWIGLKD